MGLAPSHSWEFTGVPEIWTSHLPDVVATTVQPPKSLKSKNSVNKDTPNFPGLNPLGGFQREISKTHRHLPEIWGFHKSIDSTDATDSRLNRSPMRWANPAAAPGTLNPRRTSAAKRFAQLNEERSTSSRRNYPPQPNPPKRKRDKGLAN